MFANRFTVVIDTCSLWSVLRRDLLLTLAEEEFFRPRWNSTILADLERTLKAKRPNVDSARQVQFIRSAFPEAEVSNYELYLPSVQNLPDPDDTHVIATAIACKASLIVTENLKDFPDKILGRLEIEAKCADEFIADTLDLAPERAIKILHSITTKKRNPPTTVDEQIQKWEINGLTETAAFFRPRKDVFFLNC